MNDEELKLFLDRLWRDNYNDLLAALNQNPRAIQEPSDCRTFVFENEMSAQIASAKMRGLSGVTAIQKAKKVSTVQPESLTEQVIEIAKCNGGKVKGFQLSWL